MEVGTKEKKSFWEYSPLVELNLVYLYKYWWHFKTLHFFLLTLTRNWYAPLKSKFAFHSEVIFFSNFSCRFLNPTILSNSNHNCSNVLDVRNLQEQVSKTFCNQNLFWHFAVWINYSSDLKNFSLELKKFLSITRTIFSHSK